MQLQKFSTTFLKFNLKASFVRNAKRYSSLYYDKHFEYFRSKKEYRNLVIQISNNLNQNQVAGSGFLSLPQEHKTEANDYFTHLMLRENVMKLTTTQIKDLLFLMANIKIDITKYASVLKFLDEKCAFSTERWPLDISFFILDAWFIILGHKIFKQHYYSALTNQWGRRMKRCSKHNLVLMLYYIGVSKIPPPFLMDSIENKMQGYIEDLSDEEWAVACLSFFKTSTPMTNKVLLSRAQKAVENLLTKGDRFNVIAILKCFRLSKYSEETLWNVLKDYILKEGSNFNLVECTNFLAVFASQNRYEQPVFDLLENQGMSMLKQEEDTFKNQVVQPQIHPSLRSRVKDLARLLWALTTIGHNMTEDSLNLITNNIQKRMHAGEFDFQSYVLIDCVQSLILADKYPHSILSAVLNTSTSKRIKNSDRAKPKYQLYFIQKSVQIEKPEFGFQESNLFCSIPKSLERDIKERSGFKELINILSKIPNVKFKPCYIIPHIMISGIVLNVKTNSSEDSFENDPNYLIMKKSLECGLISQHCRDMILRHKDNVCIELLDSTVCAHGNSNPNGLMNAKIRQLKKLEFKVFPLTTSDVSLLTTKVNSGKVVNTTDLFKTI